MKRANGVPTVHRWCLRCRRKLWDTGTPTRFSPELCGSCFKKKTGRTRLDANNDERYARKKMKWTHEATRRSP